MISAVILLTIRHVYKQLLSKKEAAPHQLHNNIGYFPSGYPKIMNQL